MLCQIIFIAKFGICSILLEGKITMAKSTPMTTTAAARIQSSTAKDNGGQVSSNSFAARAQSAAAKNSNTSNKK